MANVQKKVVILLVEGGTDETLLIDRLRQLFKNTEIRFEAHNGDIFYDTKQKSKPIKVMIGDKVKEILIKRKFKASNVMAVLHILDTDGCFINPENIAIDTKQSTYTYYQEGCIRVSSESQKSNIEQRNKVRSNNIRIMHSTDHVASFTYQLYYFSRNLEHVIFNEMNPQRENKFDNVEDFLEELTIPIEEFLEPFMPVPRNETYQDTHKISWEFIAEDINSLKRATNTPLIFDFLTEQM